MKKIYLNAKSNNILESKEFEKNFSKELMNSKIAEILNTKFDVSYKEIQNGITPIINECEIFISYSHKDTALAYEIAQKLIEQGKKVFLDCMYWGNIDDALEIYDEKYCKKSNGNYYYNKRNKSTAIFHMILVDSIIETIKKCKIFLLIGTNNVTAKETIGDKINLEETYSPWIYLEVKTANAVIGETSLVESQFAKKHILFPLDLANFIYLENEEDLFKNIF